MLTEPAPAKVNLFLHVGRAKANGRHPLDSLVVFAGTDAADQVSARPANTLSLTIPGPAAPARDADGDNLVLQAARALQQAAGVTSGAALTLEKHLPVAAGIGGGSADAAAALRVLTRLWNLDPLHARAVAPALGGDVPVALHGGSALMRGEGERVVPAALPGALPALLVNPGLPCPTGPVFAAFDDAGGGEHFAETALPTFDTVNQLSAWLSGQRNDLEAPACSLLPALAGVAATLAALPAAGLTRMSGSGATFWVLFPTLAAARDAGHSLSQTHPDWWVRATLLGEPVL